MRRRLRERLSGSAEDYEHELIRKDGTTTWIRVGATPYRSRSGEIHGTVGALSCIDRQKSLERENEYLRDELRDAAGMEELIGPSAALARIRNQIAMVASKQSVDRLMGLLHQRLPACLQARRLSKTHHAERPQGHRRCVVSIRGRHCFRARMYGRVFRRGRRAPAGSPIAFGKWEGSKEGER